MKKRRVFSTPDLAAANRAIAAARDVGVADDDISLVARSDIQMDEIPEDRLDVETDTVPAAVRGAGAGGALGIIAGIAAVAFPPVGITVAGAGLLALIGAAVGGWSSALAGSAVPNAVRRRFEGEIEAGRILVVIDDEEERTAAVRAALVAVGATPLEFEENSALA